MIQEDQRKASYAAALTAWRHNFNATPELRPSHVPFGLSLAEAEDVRKYGYDPSIVPETLRPDSQ